MSVVAISACGGSPSGSSPPPPPVQAPSVTCPANMTVASTGGPTVVTYPAPVVTGGTEPVSTKCTIPSGSPFPVGQSDVVCTATDAASRTATCLFQVDVTFTPMLKGTRFLAFGDSITGGEVGTPPQVFDTHTDQVYPAVLMRLMTPRYTAQTLTMLNCGQYGETASGDTGRLKSVLAGGDCGPLIPASRQRQSAPGLFDVLLLLEGTNDLNQNVALSQIIDGLQADIRNAKDAGVLQVFISTVPPLFTDAGGSVPDLNSRIRNLAASEGVVLVDSYAALGGASSTYIGVDGIHPTAAGQQLMAQAFFSAIQANFEVPPGTVMSSTKRIRR